jgi:hypothetical protein
MSLAAAAAICTSGFSFITRRFFRALIRGHELADGERFLGQAPT